LGLKRSLTQVPLEPYNELPFELALYHACKNALQTIAVAVKYVQEYGSYWLDAAKDDVERLVEAERDRSPREAETLFNAIEVALRELESSPSLAFIELLDLGSLAFLPEAVGRRELKRAVVGASLGLHVERAHKKALREAMRCVAAMTGAVLGEG